MKPFIQDSERVLNSANDLLKTSVYAENLVKVIKNTPKDKVFTIGLFGGWGTGKSSIIKTAQDRIEKSDGKVKFITYDAWKYANDSFRRMFLLKVQEALKMRQTEEMSRFYQSETAEAKPKLRLNAKGIAIAVVVLAIVSVILFLIPNVSLKWKVAVPTIGTMGTFLLALLNGCFYDLKVSISKPTIFAPEQFEACFKEMMSKCLKSVKWYQKVWNAVKDFVEVGEKSIVGLEKLIIVIDNIDRCPSDMAYQLLTDIKTFLSNEDYNLVFIVPVDDEALKKHLFRRWHNGKDSEINIQKEKEEFLRKFFNVTLRIKPHQETELSHFAHEINKENNLGYNSNTLAIVAKEFSDNPRRIIQLLNNLSGDLTLYEDEFANRYETAICAALILREEYPDFYKEAAGNLNLIREFSIDDRFYKDDNINKALIGFMRVADITLKKIPLEALQRIFTNTSSIFNELSSDIQKAVRTFDAVKVIEYANTNEEHNNTLIDFALETLKMDVKYGATSQTTQWIDFLCQLYKEGVFDNSRFEAINSALKAFYVSAIPDINNHDALCYMAGQMHADRISDLRAAILDYLSAEKAQEDLNFEAVLNSYLINLTSEQDCKDVASVVENYCVDNPINQDIAYTDIQKRILFGDSFVAKQIEDLTATDDDARLEDIIWCIKNNRELSCNTLKALFDRFKALFGDTRNRSKDVFIELINQLQPVFDVIETFSLNDEPAQIYQLVTGVRGIPHPNYRNNPQYDTKRSILDEVNEEEAKTVTGFCYEIVRMTGGNVDVSDSINKLYGKCKDAVIDGALKMQALNISIAPFANTLLQASDYESNKDLLVLELLLTPQVDGGFILDEEAIKTKLQDLISHASNKDVEKLLGKLVKHDLIKGMVTEYVASLDSNAINNLPPSVAKFAVSTFARENAVNYKDNVVFLILVLKEGNETQKKEVVRLMKDKINKEEDLDNVVLVLSNLELNDQNFLLTLVGELDGIKDSDTVADEIKKKVANLAAKLLDSIKK